MTSKNRFMLLDDDISTPTPMSPPVEKTLKFGKKLQSAPQWVSQTVASSVTASAPTPIPIQQHVVKSNLKGKKHNSRKNKEHLLKMMQNGAAGVVDAAPEVAQYTRPQPPHPHPQPLEDCHCSTWVTISVPDKSRPANCKMDNYNLEPHPISPEQTGRAFLRTRAMKYKAFRENYIRNYGPDEYDRRYMCPQYDYHWASRSAAYVPDIYDTYPPEYLPYMLMKNGTVRDFTYLQDNTEELNPVCDDLAEYVSDEEPVEKFTKYTKFLSS